MRRPAQPRDGPLNLRRPDHLNAHLLEHLVDRWRCSAEQDQSAERLFRTVDEAFKRFARGS